MKVPGQPCGPMGLPASYSKEQLCHFGWDEVNKVFTKIPKGGWASKLHFDKWSGHPPRTRKPSHYWSTRKH